MIFNFITKLMDNVLRVGKVIVKKTLPFDRKKSYFFQDKTDDISGKFQSPLYRLELMTISRKSTGVKLHNCENCYQELTYSLSSLLMAWCVRAKLTHSLALSICVTRSIIISRSLIPLISIKLLMLLHDIWPKSQFVCGWCCTWFSCFFGPAALLRRSSFQSFQLLFPVLAEMCCGIHSRLGLVPTSLSEKWKRAK